jgi:hypothetical protein
MSTVTRPRGPLPPRVYWTRRLVLLVVVLLVVFGAARLVGGGPGGTDPSVRQVGATATSSSTPTPTTTPATTPTASATAAPGATVTVTAGAGPTVGGKHAGTAAAAPLAQPTGACPASDIVVTPSVKGTAYAGRPVVFGLSLSTRTSPACTWTVSPGSVVVKVTSGVNRIWSTQQCRGAVPKESVVVRKDHPTTVPVAWNGQLSDVDCSRSTKWAEPGLYRVVAAAFGSDPAEEQFQLLTPPRPTVTKTPKPKPKPQT